MQRHEVEWTPKRLLVIFVRAKSMEHWVWNLNCLQGVREGMENEIIKPANMNFSFQKFDLQLKERSQ